MFRSAHVRPRAFWLWLAVFIIIVFVAAPQAQQQLSPVSYSGAGAIASATEPSTISLLVGRSTVLNVGAPIARLSLTVPEIADALVTAPQQILIHGKNPGTISMFVWEKSGAIRTYEVVVRRDLSVLANQLRQLFPGEPITVTGSGKDVVLSGKVSTPYVVEKAAEVAVAYAEKKENVVNLLKLQEGQASNQVMLRVRFAEVSRSALQELGTSFFTGPGGYRDYIARTTTAQFPANHYDEMERVSLQGPDNWGGGRDTVTATGGKQTFSDFLNIFLFNNRYNVGTLVRALQTRGLFQSLAEPNLIATNGKEASFLAGGEYPYPVAQPSASGVTYSIHFKEFGVRLRFTPTVLGGDLINLKVEPEVSALDFTNAIILDGFRIPALSTRRTQTEVELRDGQTFAIAGLLNNTLTTSMQKIPGIGDIPILGLLFKSRAHQKNETELVVMITPHIVKRGSTGVSESLPNLVDPFLGPPHRSMPPPTPYSGSPRHGATEQSPQATVTPPQQPAPAPATQTPKPAPQQRSGAVATQPKAMAAAAPAPAKNAPAPQLSKRDLKRLEEARKKAEEERELEAKRQAEAQKAAQKAAAEEKRRQEIAAREALKKAEEEKKRLEQAAREQAKRDAEAARKAEEESKRAAAEEKKAEAERRKAEETRKKLAAEEARRQAELAAAEKKLKEAQAAYEAIIRTGESPKPVGQPQAQSKPNGGGM